MVIFMVFDIFWCFRFGTWDDISRVWWMSPFDIPPSSRGGNKVSEVKSAIRLVRVPVLVSCQSGSFYQWRGGGMVDRVSAGAGGRMEGATLPSSFLV